jgi:hypothetical protein
MIHKDLNTPIWQLTAGDLLELLSERTKPIEQPEEPLKCNENLVYGIHGIAKLFGVSRQMIHEYRRQGWIEPAIQQVGRNIICNAPLALELHKKRGVDMMSHTTGKNRTDHRN